MSGAARAPTSNRWAVASCTVSLVPIVSFAALLLVEATRGRASRTLDAVFYLSVPVAGLLAVSAGLRARGRPDGRVMRTIGLALGTVELALTVLVVVGLARAFRTLGA